MEYLHSQTTKELLGILDSARSCGGSYHPFYDSGYAPPGTRAYTITEIKSVLATREHVPNKLEAKRIRQLKAKQRIPKNKNTGGAKNV